jgi:glycosyltransferase involved in cell wall biosynthesis
VRWLNKRIIGRVAGAIVSGPSHLRVFEGILPPERVHIAANYAGEDLFVAPTQVAAKFATIRPIRMLYISHMTRMKGYERLLQAFLASSGEVKEAIRIDFAGAFDAPEERQAFLDTIGEDDRLRYHGVVDGATKIALLQQSHAFCLPTAHLEGQPISILEAFAAGCVVVASHQPGIRDIFTPGENGYEPEANTAEGLAEVLRRMVAERDSLATIAIRNRELAGDRYRVSTAMERVGRIIESVQP